MRGPNMSEDFLSPEKALETLRAIQTVIEGRVSRLEGLRKMKNASDFTQHEIISLEGKIIQLFGRQLAIRQKSTNTENHEEIEQYPNLQQWLYVMDIHQEAQKLLATKLKTIMALLDMSDCEIKTMMKVSGCTDEEIKRLLTALKNIHKVCLTQIEENNSSPITPKEPAKSNLEPSEPDDTDSPPNSPSESSSPSQKHPSSSSLGSDADQGFSESLHTLPTTPPPYNDVHPSSLYTVTPPSTPSYKKHRHKGTPPPSKKMIQVNLGLPDSISLKRSKSSEATFPNKVDMSENPVSKFSRRFNNHEHSFGGSLEALNQQRRHSEDSALEPGRRSSSSSPQKQYPNHQPNLVKIDGNTLGVPKSPRTPSKMYHKILHRFTKRTFLKPVQCAYCRDKVLLNGYKCKECKYVCHSKCKNFAETVPSCCLPSKFEEIFIESIKNPGVSTSRLSLDLLLDEEQENSPSPILHRRSVPSDATYYSGRSTPTSFPAFSQGESSSNPSSTTSSTPSSPAPFQTTSASLTPSSPALASPALNNVPRFKFPDVTHINGDDIDQNEFIHSVNSDRTLTIDSTDSFLPLTDSERTLPEKTDSIDDGSDGDSPDHVIQRQHCKSIVSEWDIPFEQLELIEKIGEGRFGPVYRGNWHGEVAIKMINIDQNDENQLNAFKTEVSQFKKTRHENIILFTGACMHPPHLAIITNYCRGNTLHTHIHIRKDRFGINKTVLIATQIAQGMGYLHAKGIIHKDLKSKNIFIENGKVVITDFALFNLARLSREKRKGNMLVIPDGWLCYLAPELIKALRINEEGLGMDLPFSEKTDMYAFGTVWYELLVGEWPFSNEPAESIIWKVGKGLKQPLTQVQASRDVKDILMMCWSYHPESRPDFYEIKKTLERLPKKRGHLHRSPSHPLHLSRSAESII